MQYIKHLFELYLSYMTVALVTMLVAGMCLVFSAGSNTQFIFIIPILAFFLGVLTGLVVELRHRKDMQRIQEELKVVKDYLISISENKPVQGRAHSTFRQ